MATYGPAGKSYGCHGAPILGGPLDLDKLEETIAQRFLAIPRFKQHVESRGGEYWWADDPYFDESRHIKRVRLPGKADQRELQRYVAQLASEHLDKARPLWQLHIVEDYQGGAAIIIRIHHAIADGMALVGMMLSVMDGGDQRAWTAHSKAEPPAWLSLPGIKALQKSLGVTTDLLNEAAALAANPAKTAKIGAGVAGELAWLLLMPEDSWTRFKGKPSGNKRVAWTDPIPLHEVKAVSKALGCTINDVLLASVAGALCQYLKDKGDPVKGIEIRALVPVDMRKSYEAGQLGNKFGIVGVELPVGIENPLKRLYEVHRRMQALKQSLEPPVTLGMFAVLGYAPQMVQDRLFNLLIAPRYRRHDERPRTADARFTSAARRSSRSCSGFRNRAISGWGSRSCPSTAWCSSGSSPTRRWCPIPRRSSRISGRSSSSCCTTC